jgi:hypothetical protein
MTQPRKPVKRRDATGHLDPEYERGLLEQSASYRRADVYSNAFLTTTNPEEELAEELGEAFVGAATSGGDVEGDRHERIVPEESGGPFVTTTANEEFAGGTDESNIAEATREPLPRTSKAEP